MAHILKGSHSFACTPRVHPLTEWTIPAFAFPAKAGTHLAIPEGWKAELALAKAELALELTNNYHSEKHSDGLSEKQMLI